MTRSTALVLAALLAAALAPAQWLETTIDLPQSPEAVCWNPANNRVYCAVGYPDAYGAVVVIDGATNAVLDTLLVGDVAPGDWLLAFQGSAIRVLSAGEAAETDAALDALEAVLAGADDVSKHFADLVDREPELPAHLRGGG